MPIYVDVSSAVHAKAGIGRYAGSLARALVACQPQRFALFYNRSRDSRAPAGLESVPARTVRAGYKPWRLAVWLGQLARADFGRLVPGAELFHATEHLLPPLRVPTVLTVHDLIFRLFPEHQKRLNYLFLNAAMPLFCRRAGAIITVSEASKRDIVEHYRLDAGRVTVVHEAAGPGFQLSRPEVADEARRRYGLPDEYLIRVGTIEPRKNLTRLIKALELLSARGVSVPLVIVGGRGWLYESFFRTLRESEIRSLVYLPGYVPPADLPLLYGAARASVMPSIYEGFGLPILESMACGVPVASADNSSLPEVGGDAARYFNAYDVDGMASAIHEVWTDVDLREELRRRGLEQASRFTWERAAHETLAVYESVLQSRRNGR